MAGIIVTLLAVAAVAQAGTEDAGELSNPGEGDCTASAVGDREFDLSGSLKFKADWTFDENSGGKVDRWTFRLYAHWQSWPTGQDLLGNPTGSSPGDKDDEHVESDIPGADQEGITGEVQTTYWSNLDFELDGRYVVEVTIEVLHEVKPEGGGSWSQSCSDSDAVAFTINYTDPNGGGGEPRIETAT